VGMVYSVLPGKLTVVFLSASNKLLSEKLREMNGPMLEGPKFVKGG